MSQKELDVERALGRLIELGFEGHEPAEVAELELESADAGAALLRSEDAAAILTDLSDIHKLRSAHHIHARALARIGDRERGLVFRSLPGPREEVQATKRLFRNVRSLLRPRVRESAYRRHGRADNTFLRGLRRRGPGPDRGPRHRHAP